MSIIMMGTMAALALIVGGVVDYASLGNQKRDLQNVADGAALAAARELVVTAPTEMRLLSVAEAYVAANLKAEHIAVTAALGADKRSIEVSVAADPKVFFPGPIGANAKRQSASATAAIYGGGNVCMIGLDTKSGSTLNMKNKARLTAGGCAIYSNSLDKHSITIQSNASVRASLVCAAGGVDGVKAAINPAAIEDCPPIEDPLASRPAPPIGGCTQTDLEVKSVQTLTPGTYCGGLKVTGGTATLQPGVYVIKDGPLTVTAGGSLSGENAGFFLTGSKSVVTFDTTSHIDLSGPQKGPMSGLLFSEDRTTTFAANHKFASDDARRLEGTLYFPNSKLLIEAKNPIADRSDYTVIIAREFELRDGPELVLKTNYGASNVPLPEGVGNRALARTRLIE